MLAVGVELLRLICIIRRGEPWELYCTCAVDKSMYIYIYKAGRHWSYIPITECTLKSPEIDLECCL